MAPKNRRRNKSKKPTTTNPPPGPVDDRLAKIPPLGNRWNKLKMELTLDPTVNEVVGQTMLDYTITIPPIPAKYNMYDPKFMDKFKYPPPPPEMSLETENELRLEGLRNTKIFDSALISRQSFQWMPTKVKLIGLTPQGTVIVSFVDDRSLGRFTNLQGRIAMWFIIMGMKGLDTKMDKKDIQKGLIVLAKTDENTWIRAKVLDVLKKLVVVVGVDEVKIFALDYSDIYYYTKHLHDCPFHAVECHLSRLEKWERTWVLDLIMNRMKHVTGTPGYFYVTEFKTVEEKYFVEIDFPAKMGKDVSMNQCILDQINKFDPFVDLQVTP